VGTYKLADKFLLKVFRVDDALLVRATGQGPIPIFPICAQRIFRQSGQSQRQLHARSERRRQRTCAAPERRRSAPKLSASEVPPEPQEIAFDAITSGDVAGKYQLDSGDMLDVALKGDHLEAQLTGQPAVPIFPSGKDKFFTRSSTRNSSSNAMGTERSSRRFCTKAGAICGRPALRAMMISA